ncbi:MAG: hypothetical protein NXH70_02425 [Hyphomonas sp.]|nr:hypothetical protein [Hyphomonas sp.]
MTKVRGSKRLGQWIAHPETEVIERYHKRRFKDVMIVIRRKTTGAKIVIVTRKHKDSYRNGEKTITTARKTNQETWPIDAHLLRKSSRYKPDKVILYLVDTDDFWLSDFKDWFDTTIRITRRSKYGGEEIFHMPSDNMIHIPSYTHLRSLT